METEHLDPQTRDQILSDSRGFLMQVFRESFQIDPFEFNWAGSYEWRETGDYHEPEGFAPTKQLMYELRVISNQNQYVAVAVLGTGVYDFDDDRSLPILNRIVSLTMCSLDESEFSGIKQEDKEKYICDYIDGDWRETLLHIPQNYLKVQWVARLDESWDYNEDPEQNGVRIFNFSDDQKLLKEREALNLIIASSQENFVFQSSFRGYMKDGQLISSS